LGGWIRTNANNILSVNLMATNIGMSVPEAIAMPIDVNWSIDSRMHFSPMSELGFFKLDTFASNIYLAIDLCDNPSLVFALWKGHCPTSPQSGFFIGCIWIWIGLVLQQRGALKPTVHPSIIILSCREHFIVSIINA
jgi:hypothetical protein